MLYDILHIFKIFFTTIRKTWYKCYLLALIDVVVGGFILLNLYIFFQMDTNALLPRLSFGVTLLTLFIFVVANVPAWVLVAVWDVPLKRIISFSVQLVFINPFWTSVTGICFALPFLFALTLPAAFFVTIVGAVSGAIAAYGTSYLMRTYLPDPQMNLIDI